ncbi:hypothetical protein [Alkaliphilus sp. B6464]|uniref:hypothetical protein n=1 Tax=Alkaliphilus sp. B6464 TaxID=2731219 RepID=UPI001BA85236|nr:hypothetical protein [Alkaliphilus sp. B6464]QUH21890.1 hypothetical protein HYG84_18310 [Alkaliphilus sp. B6464]
MKGMEEITLLKEPLIETRENALYINDLMIYHSKEENIIDVIYAKLNTALKNDKEKVLLEVSKDILLINGKEIVKGSEEVADVLFIRLKSAFKNFR